VRLKDHFAAKHFDRDPDTNEVLWFAAPPVNVARPPAPKHSLAYLHFLASKRKNESHATGVMDGRKIPPSASETLMSVLDDFSKGETI
jgi:chromatin structure-remodeling complex subunit RSC1/2